MSCASSPSRNTSTGTTEEEDCFVLIRDDGGERKRNFKVRFRTCEEFFRVTVSKLRRAISSAISASSSSQDSNSFSLIFEDLGEKYLLPEGDLAEHALVADFGIRPLSHISLSWKTTTTSTKNSTPQQQHSHGRNNNNNNNNFISSETIPSPPPANHNHNHLNSSVQHLLQSSTSLRQKISTTTTTTATTTRHEDDVEQEQANTNNNRQEVLASAGFLLSDSLTPQQRELQMRWFRETLGGNEKEEEEKEEEDRQHQKHRDNFSYSHLHQPIVVNTSEQRQLPPLSGFQHQHQQQSQHQHRRTVTFLEQHEAEQQQQQQQQRQQQIHRDSISPPSSKRAQSYGSEEGLEYEDVTSSSSSSSSSPPATSSTFSSQHQNPNNIIMKQYQPQQQQHYDVLKPLPSANNNNQEDLLRFHKQHHQQQNHSSSSSPTPQATSMTKAAPVVIENRIQQAVRDADRKENIKFQMQIAHLTNQVQVWKERASSALAGLEGRIGATSSCYGIDSTTRRALAEALVDVDTLRRQSSNSQKHLEEVRQQLENEKRVRRGMQRELEFLRGNIRVLCRIRGGGGDDNHNNNTAFRISGDGTMIVVDRGVLKPRGEFEFFRVLPRQTTQWQIFTNEIAPLIDVALLNKRNLCLVAYGQTSGGKSYSLFNLPPEEEEEEDDEEEGMNNDQMEYEREEGKERKRSIFGDDLSPLSERRRAQLEEEKSALEETSQEGIAIRAARMLLKHFQIEKKTASSFSSSSNFKRQLNNNQKSNNKNKQQQNKNNVMNNKKKKGAGSIHYNNNTFHDEVAEEEDDDEEEEEEDVDRVDVGLSIVELYCDDLRDLITGEKLADKHAACISVFRSEQDALELLRRGVKERITESTRCNAVSSRSHCLVTFSVIRRGSVEVKITLADLAGSERLARSQSTGQRKVEAAFINKSLSALGDVVHALSSSAAASATSGVVAGGAVEKKMPHIPYRNSSLTMMLQDVMGTNTTTIFLACIVDGSSSSSSSSSSGSGKSDDHEKVEESFATLQFASRVRCIRNVQVTRAGPIERVPIAATASSGVANSASPSVSSSSSSSAVQVPITSAAQQHQQQQQQQHAARPKLNRRASSALTPTNTNLHRNYNHQQQKRQEETTSQHHQEEETSHQHDQQHQTVIHGNSATEAMKLKQTLEMRRRKSPKHTSIQLL